MQQEGSHLTVMSPGSKVTHWARTTMMKYGGGFRSLIMQQWLANKSGTSDNKPEHVHFVVMICTHHSWISPRYCSVACDKYPCMDAHTSAYFIKWPSSKENASCVTNILDISTKLIPLYSPSTPTSLAPNYITLSPLLMELAYLAMLFIFLVTHSDPSSVCHLKNK